MTNLILEQTRLVVVSHLFELSVNLASFVGRLNLAMFAEEISSEESAKINFKGYRLDWFQSALQCCFELGLPVIPEQAIRLLEDFEFFESQLPIPVDSPEWGTITGTEVMLQWWFWTDERYRHAHLRAFKHFMMLADLSEIKQSLAIDHRRNTCRFVTRKPRQWRLNDDFTE